MAENASSFDTSVTDDLFSCFKDHSQRLKEYQCATG